MQIVLGLGTNLGDRFAALKTAINELQAHLSTCIFSSVYSSPALLLPDSPKSWDRDFLNMAVRGETALSPQGLLSFCKKIESTMGRGSDYKKWSPRVIDIDILAYGDTSHNSPDLSIPHKDLLLRPFAVFPFADVWPDWTPPQKTKTIRELANSFPQHDIKRVGHFA